MDQKVSSMCATNGALQLKDFVVGLLYFLLPLVLIGVSHGQVREEGSPKTSLSDVGKYLPVSLDLSQLIGDIRTKKDGIQKLYAHDPEELKEELARLGEEFRQRQKKIFEERGITEKEYLQWGREGLKNTEELSSYLQSHPEIKVGEGLKQTPEESLKNEGFDLTVDSLLAALDDQKESIRWNAAKLLGQRNNQAILPALHSRLQDSDSRVQIYSASSLCMLQDYSGVPLLVNRLRSERDWKIRFAIVTELDKCREAEGILSVLIQALQDEHKFVRITASRQLGKISNPLVLSELKKVVEGEKDEIVRSILEKQILELSR